MAVDACIHDHRHSRTASLKMDSRDNLVHRNKTSFDPHQRRQMGGYLLLQAKTPKTDFIFLLLSAGENLTGTETWLLAT